MKHTLSTIIPHFLIALPLTLPFITYEAFGITGFEVSKTIFFFVSLIFICFSLVWYKKSLTIPKVFFVVLMWIGWNCITSLVNGTFFVSLVGDTFFLFGLFTLLLLFIYGCLVQNIVNKPLSHIIYLGFSITAILHSIFIIIHFFLEKTGIIVQSMNDRYSSTLGEPNWLGSILMVSLVIITSYVFFERKKSLFTLGTILIVSIGVILTGSRSTFIAIAISLLCMGVIVRKKLQSKQALSLLVGGISFILVLCVTIGAFPNIFIRLVPSNVSKSVRGLNGVDNRMWLYQKGIKIALQKPLFGWGWEQIGSAYTRELSGTYPGLEKLLVLRSHNVFLDVWITGGIVSVILFSSVIIMSLYNGINLYKRQKNFIWLSGIISIFGLLVYGQFNTYSIAHWVIFFFMLGIVNIKNDALV